MIDIELLRALYKKDEAELTDVLNTNPRYVRPVITQADVESKKIIRYFARPANDVNTIVEIDKTQYEELKSNFRFVVTKLDWKIVGNKKTLYLNNNINLYGVEELNKIEVSNIDLTFGGLRKYITNYLEFWQSEK